MKTLGILCVFTAIVLLASTDAMADDQPAQANEVNLAVVAELSTSYVSHHESLDAINDGLTPEHSQDRAGAVYGNWPETGEQWVQVSFPHAVTTNGIGVYWFEDSQGIRLPESARLAYRDGERWVQIPVTVGVEPNTENTIAFDPVQTDALRLYFTGQGTFSTGILEWRVFDEGSSPILPPRVDAGIDRVVILNTPTYLNAQVRSTGQRGAQGAWQRVSGPGNVTFSGADAASTSASFDTPGEYVIAYRVEAGDLWSQDELRVRVMPTLEVADLQPVETLPYSLDSAFWEPRIRNAIINWIPHVIARCEDPDLAEGGLNNLRDAAAALRGEPHGYHRGYWFSNAWVLNTFEAMCLAQMVDAGDDRELADAQQMLMQKIEEWLELILAAQEPDGYFQTRFTLGFYEGENPQRFDPMHRIDHEGYVAGYFLDAAVAHYRMTNGQDRRFYDAAMRLADCWATAIGPGPDRQPWWDEHQGMELSLFRFARLVDEVEGAGEGQPYRDLSLFLMDCRGVHGSGAEYDQAHLPVTQQYEAVGHAVRAVYLYTGMAEAARAYDDPAYQSAVMSIYDNIVNRKLYVTGGVGSGETPEGFGEDYSLPHNAYCESCSGIGHMMFQHRMNLLTANAQHADLYELTFYNAVLSDLDINGDNFTYTNPLATTDQRYSWHVCPCCVGNIPRALLSLPTWSYTTDEDALYVNLYIGGSMTVPDVAGTSLRIDQQTDYPRSGVVQITLHPEQPSEFAVFLRVPDRSVSELYESTPAAEGLLALSVNGEVVQAEIVDGYARIQREWSDGDTIELTLPMPVQRVHCIDVVSANRGMVALQRGPLMFNLESVDQPINTALSPAAQLTAVYNPDLLGGVMTIQGTFTNGDPFTAIPNYARNNRGGYSTVWIQEAE